MNDEAQVRKDILQIYESMAKALGRDVSAINENTLLWKDLRLTGPIKSVMSDPLSQYTAKRKARRILRSEAGGFNKIKDAADLVVKLINSVEKEK